MIKLSELPNYFRMHYQSMWNWGGKVCLLRLGEIKYPDNPYCAVQERQVQNQIVRWLRRKPLTLYETLGVIRSDGTSWTIQLMNFKDYEFIDEVECDV